LNRVINRERERERERESKNAPSVVAVEKVLNFVKMYSVKIISN